ncbi:sodium:solute symporter family protein [Janibacter cremeus]|uniref:Sodium/pantothenate symporter n=1 Tax=Janibacter cremeus TaxID=1285192 RepID=A0A852VKW9_9MICO|nr:sodium/solute symporter [Janibacter cremeus]NYF97682.1 sodium/pantothenate symporter [Janibacter cremeus]
MTLLVIALYFVFLSVIGWLAYRRVKGSTDQFFVAERSLGTFVNSWAFLASLASGGSMLAGVGTAMALGFPYIAATTAGAVVGFVVASIVVAKPLRALGEYTVPDYFRARFQSRIIAWVVPLIILVGSMAYLVAQLKAASIVTEYALGWDYSVGVIVTGLLFTAYVSAGGFLAVSWNDVFQGILMFAGLVGLIIAALGTIDGFSGSFNMALTDYPALGTGSGTDVSPATYVGAFITGVTVMSVLPHVIMRVFSAKSVKSAKVSLNVSMLIYAAMMLGSATVLTVAATTIPSVTSESGDEAFLLIVEKVLGPVGQGVIMAAVLAAIMSTTAGLLMVCNAVVANDIFSRVLRPEAPQRTIVRVAGGATWIVGVLAILLALNPPDLLIVLYIAAQGFIAASLFFPMVLGMWWSRCTTSGAIAGVIGGAVIFAIMFAWGGLGTSAEVVVALPASLILTVVVSLMSGESKVGRTEQVERVV